MHSFSYGNKNRYVIEYLEYLSMNVVLDEIEVGFMRIGYTYSEIYRAFSSTSDQRRQNDAITMSNLYFQPSKCYNASTVVMSFRECSNWSTLCDKIKCLNKANKKTDFRFFRLVAEKVVFLERSLYNTEVVCTVCSTFGTPGCL